MSEPDEAEEEVEAEYELQEKDQAVLFNVKVRRPFLQRMKDAVGKSDGKYESSSDLARTAMEEKVRWIEAGMPEPSEEWADEKPGKRDLVHEKQVKALLKIIDEELEETGIIPFVGVDTDDFIEAAKHAKLKGKAALFSDSRVQSSMRQHLKDFVCPEGFWDSKRKWDAKEGAKLIETFRKQLQIPRTVAAGLVKNPGCEADCKSCPHAEEEESEEE